MKNIRYLGIIVTFSLPVTSCNIDSSDVDVSGIKVEAKALRFEQDLFRKPVDIPALNNKYGSFFDVFTHRIINIPEPMDALTTIKMEKENGVFVVPCTVNSLKLNFIFDTGASIVSIGLAEAIFMLKNGYLKKEDIKDLTNLSVATGEISVGTNIILRKIEFAGYTLNNVEATIVHKLSAPLLLGQSALSKIGTFQLNPNTGVLTILNSSSSNINNNLQSEYNNQGHDTLVYNQLNHFVSDPEVRDLYNLTDSTYKNLNDVEKGMEEFLKHLRYYFPDEPTPRVITFISAFNYAVITTDSAIGIGLDMFLGPDILYYPRLGIPKYMFNRFRREYIVPSAIKAWFQSEYDIAEVKNEFLSQMIYQGKLIYFSKAMCPDMSDTLLTGYSASQLDWCEKSEANIWSFFIENKMLFNTDPSQFAKFINEGPSTSGFPEEAPGKLGAWTGWQIVKAYAENNTELSLPELMQETDAQKILEKSGYKPKK